MQKRTVQNFNTFFNQQISCQSTPRQSRLLSPDPDLTAPKEYTTDSDPEQACSTPRQRPTRRSQRNSTGSNPFYLQSPNNNSPESVFSRPAVIRRSPSTSSSTDSSDDECRIVPDELVKDDYLETLDRKVTEVINRSRNSAADLSRTNSDKYGPLSMSYNRRKKPTAPAIVTKTPSSSDNALTEDMASNNNNNISRPSSLVRFDEEDNAQDTQESSQDEMSPGGWSDDEVMDKTRQAIKRRSFSRRPIRSRNRLSVMSVQSALTASSAEESHTTEYPCSSSQRSTMENKFAINTHAGLNSCSSEDEDTEVASQAASSMTPRQLSTNV